MQKPHWRPCFSQKACCSGWRPPSGVIPSIVVTLLPSAWTASIVQDFTAWPSTWTVQAPHWLVSQPTWVPVELEVLAEQLHEQPSRLDVRLPLLPVDRERNVLGHQWSLLPLCGLAGRWNGVESRESRERAGGQSGRPPTLAPLRYGIKRVPAQGRRCVRILLRANAPLSGGVARSGRRRRGPPTGCRRPADRGWRRAPSDPGAPPGGPPPPGRRAWRALARGSGPRGWTRWRDRRGRGRGRRSMRRSGPPRPASRSVRGPRRRVERAADDPAVAGRLGDQPPVVGAGDQVEGVARKRQVEQGRGTQRVGVAAGQDERKVGATVGDVRQAAQGRGQRAVRVASSPAAATASGSSISTSGQPASARARTVRPIVSATQQRVVAGPSCGRERAEECLLHGERRRRGGGTASRRRSPSRRRPGRARRGRR